MYLRGLSAMGDGWFDDTAASISGPTQSTDWTGLISSALQTYGNIEVAKTQAEIAANRPPYMPGYSPLNYPAASGTYPGYSPFPAAQQSAAGLLMPLLLVAGVGGALWFALK